MSAIVWCPTGELYGCHAATTYGLNYWINIKDRSSRAPEHLIACNYDAPGPSFLPPWGSLLGCEASVTAVVVALLSRKRVKLKRQAYPDRPTQEGL